MNTMLTRTLAFLMLAVAAAACGDDGDAAAPSTCGNNVLDTGEACDTMGVAPNAVPLFPQGTTCATATNGMMTDGQLGCAGCMLDVSRCVGGGVAASGGTGG